MNEVYYCPKCYKSVDPYIKEDSNGDCYCPYCCKKIIVVTRRPLGYYIPIWYPKGRNDAEG